MKHQEEKSGSCRKETANSLWENPAFSFRYCLEEGNHGLQGPRRDGEKAEQEQALLAFLCKTSQLSWAEIEKMNRQHGGFEEIPASELQADLQEKLPLVLRQERLLSFYFGGNKYRLLGMRDPDREFVFYILGFDWDFSLYHHGD